jgi:hypothetical protein
MDLKVILQLVILAYVELSFSRGEKGFCSSSRSIMAQSETNILLWIPASSHRSVVVLQAMAASKVW